MTNEEIQNDIVDACKKFREAGFELTSGCFTSFGEADGEPPRPCGGCALTAVAWRELGDAVWNDGHITAVATKRYGWPPLEYWQFADGFDGVERASTPTPTYTLGQAVRAAVLG